MANELLADALQKIPVHLAPIVELSCTDPQCFDAGVLRRLVRLLSDENDVRMDAAARLACINALANVALDSTRRQSVLKHISEISRWFDHHLRSNEGAEPASTAAAGPVADDELRVLGDVRPPRFHMAMVVLLARCENYKLCCSDLIELVDGDLVLALATLAGLLDASWSREGSGSRLSTPEHEPELVLQFCSLLRGFTQPASYFGLPTEMCAETQFDIEEGGGVSLFRAKMDGLLALILEGRLVRTVIGCLRSSIFHGVHHGADRSDDDVSPGLFSDISEEDDDDDDDEHGWFDSQRQSRKIVDQAKPSLREPVETSVTCGGNKQLVDRGSSSNSFDLANDQRENVGDGQNTGDDRGRIDRCARYHEPGRFKLLPAHHRAVLAVLSFLHNLHIFISPCHLTLYRRHLLLHTPLIPGLLAPYLRCCLQRAGASSGGVSGGVSAEEEAQLAQGVCACFRLLLVATFRVPWLSVDVVMNGDGSWRSRGRCVGRRDRPISLWSLMGAHIFTSCSDFLRQQPPVLALLICFHINVGSLDDQHAFAVMDATGSKAADEDETGDIDAMDSDDSDLADFSDDDGGDGPWSSLCHAEEAASPIRNNSNRPASGSVLAQLQALCTTLETDARHIVTSIVEGHREGQLPVARDGVSYRVATSMLNELGSVALELHSDRDAKSEDIEAKPLPSDIVPKLASHSIAVHAEDMVAGELDDPEHKAEAKVVCKWKGSNEQASDKAHMQHGDDDDHQDRAVGAAQAKFSTTGPCMPERKGQRNVRFRLLGDLPNLPLLGSRYNSAGAPEEGLNGEPVSARAKSNPKTERRSRKGRKRRQNQQQRLEVAPRPEFGTKRSEVVTQAALPVEMCCAINGHVLKEPMRSRSTRLVYERNTIELWLDSHGHVCPVTGEPLELDDLFLDEQLQHRICSWHVTQACKSSAQGAADLFGDSEAIYNF